MSTNSASPIKAVSPQVTPDAELVLWVHLTDGTCHKHVVPDPWNYLDMASRALIGQNERHRLSRHRAEEAYAEAYAKMRLA